MTYTTTPPIEEGWYWWRGTAEHRWRIIEADMYGYYQGIPTVVVPPTIGSRIGQWGSENGQTPTKLTEPTD